MASRFLIISCPVTIQSSQTAKRAPNFLDVYLFHPFCMYVKYASDYVGLERQGIPQCISPQPAGAVAMLESAYFKVQMCVSMQSRSSHDRT